MSAEKIATVVGDKALQYLDLFEQAVVKYSPDAVEAVLMVTRVHGLSIIIPALVALLVGIVVGVWGVRFIRKGFALQKQHEEGFPHVVGGACMFFVSILFLGESLSKLLNIWNWVAIIEPKLWLAYKMFDKVLN